MNPVALHTLRSDPIFNSVIDLFIKIHPKPNYSINNPKPNEKNILYMCVRERERERERDPVGE